jgi:hypothetical protein
MEGVVDNDWGGVQHNDEDYNRDPEAYKHRDLCTFAERSGRLLKLPLYTPVMDGACGGEGAPNSTIYNDGGSASLGGPGRIDEERSMVHATNHGTPDIITQESEEPAAAIEKRCTPWMAIDPVFLRDAGGGRGEVVMVNESESESSCSESESEIGSRGDGEGRGTGNENGKGKEPAGPGGNPCVMRKPSDENNCHSAERYRVASLAALAALDKATTDGMFSLSAMDFTIGIYGGDSVLIRGFPSSSLRY